MEIDSAELAHLFYECDRNASQLDDCEEDEKEFLYQSMESMCESALKMLRSRNVR